MGVVMSDKPTRKAEMLAMTAELMAVLEKHLGAKPERSSVYFADDEFMELTIYMGVAGFDFGMGLPKSMTKAV